MANSKKNKKFKPADPKKMNADIPEKIEVKKLLKDERSHKIAGTVLILVAFLLFVSFTSYLFTWQEDQSKVAKGAKILLPGHAEAMSNLLGTAGAYFSDLFFRYGFGVASYLICTFFFVVGVNLFSPRKIFSIGRNIRYVIVGLLVVSVSASFFMSGHPFPWGGAVGDMESQWLKQVIGRVGTAALLVVAVLCYIIWRFNPSFHFKNKKLYSCADFP
jgi:DNA segregation ATPase FtsK/SpoIIIE, S-DNA-T family